MSPPTISSSAGKNRSTAASKNIHGQAALEHQHIGRLQIPVGNGGSKPVEVA
jgi:hypothetical protein